LNIEVAVQVALLILWGWSPHIRQ